MKETVRVKVQLPSLVREVIDSVANSLARLEAAPSKRGLPAGSARGGRQFEHAMHVAWRSLLKALAKAGCHLTAASSGDRYMTVVSSPTNKRRLLLGIKPSALGARVTTKRVDEVPPMWAETKYLVSALIEKHLGRGPLPFVPEGPEDSRNFSGPNYPRIFAGKTSEFDFTAVCEEAGTLVEKMLFEYKSAKSTKGITVDGNAHERLSYQTLQYLEIASGAPNISFNVIASSAFVHYHNKYHATFNQQAIRLGDTYRFFVMRFVSSLSEYRRFFGMLAGFALGVGELQRDYRLVEL